MDRADELLLTALLADAERRHFEAIRDYAFIAAIIEASR